MHSAVLLHRCTYMYTFKKKTKKKTNRDFVQFLSHVTANYINLLNVRCNVVYMYMYIAMKWVELIILSLHPLAIYLILWL